MESLSYSKVDVVLRQTNNRIREISNGVNAGFLRMRPECLTKPHFEFVPEPMPFVDYCNNNQKPEFGGPPNTPEETTTRYTTQTTKRTTTTTHWSTTTPETTTSTTTTTTTISTQTPTIPTSSSGTGSTPSFDYCEYGADGIVNKNPNQTIIYDFDIPAQGHGQI